MNKEKKIIASVIKSKRLIQERKRKVMQSRIAARRIWTEKVGKIPSGYIVHHKDGNPLNNSIGNLDCITWSQHGKAHTKMGRARKEQERENKMFLEYINRG